MKIYPIVPEPLCQKIYHWMEYGTHRSSNNWSELFGKCNDAYFDKVGAEKAELKVHSKKKGEAQVFR